MINNSNKTNALDITLTEIIYKKHVVCGFCTENENVATACRMMMMSMKMKKEEVHRHPSHTVLPVHRHHQPLFRTDQGLPDIGVTGGKYYKNPGISVHHSGILALFLGGHMPDCLSKPSFPMFFFFCEFLYNI